MTGFDRSVGFLRHLSPSGLGESQLRHKLTTTGEVIIGRDFGCEIVLDSDEYGMVSRRHAAVRPVNAGIWEICDLNSANGTYVNGERLQGCRYLRTGDRIQLGKNGPEFIFEYNPISQTPGSFRSAPTHAARPLMATPAISNPSGRLDRVTISQLFPILSTGRQLKQKAFLMPAIVTVGFVVLMFTAVGEPLAFNMLLAAYLAGAAYYFVYQLCGKHKPWWVLLASALMTVLILVSPLLQVFLLIFREFLPGSIPTETESVSFPVLLMRMFFGAGLMEELLKALPVVGAYLLARQLPSPWRERIGVWEPLDGILLGAASAVGFTLLETLGQYVPEAIQNVTFQAGEGAGQLVGLQLLIPRIMGSVAGHMAYSGYLGYFIGLSVLKPRNFWKILGVGYLSAAGLHALWNATGFFSGFGLAVVGVLSYAFLAAAILKARALSPTRSQNFATRFITRP
ncbi:PrsW family glutamic-type intramembrane protease [Microseira sp. BLCC-F43]|jgi:RsiW-degrading membrane proteinase PrsW (M82 family)|uniref:PrsW family glutamic-type intramembrane protease n=1 Tax=Microseira sp. BLCC-F43 TaxID=3153602 RepID=UPI0035BB39F0